MRVPDDRIERVPVHELETYFTAEKHGASLLLALALGALALGAFVRATDSPFRAMAWPLAIIALAEAGIGVGLLVRTNPQVARLRDGLATAPGVTVEAELERMRKVNRAWLPVETVEVCLIVTGVGLAIAGKYADPGWTAVGMGLLLQVGALLVLDLFAEHRALHYTDWLERVSLRVAAGV